MPCSYINSLYQTSGPEFRAKFSEFSIPTRIIISEFRFSHFESFPIQIFEKNIFFLGMSIVPISQNCIFRNSIHSKIGKSNFSNTCNSGSFQYRDSIFNVEIELQDRLNWINFLKIPKNEMEFWIVKWNSNSKKWTNQSKNNGILFPKKFEIMWKFLKNGKISRKLEN